MSDAFCCSLPQPCVCHSWHCFQSVSSLLTGAVHHNKVLTNTQTSSVWWYISMMFSKTLFFFLSCLRFNNKCSFPSNHNLDSYIYFLNYEPSFVWLFSSGQQWMHLLTGIGCNSTWYIFFLCVTVLKHSPKSIKNTSIRNTIVQSPQRALMFFRTSLDLPCNMFSSFLAVIFGLPHNPFALPCWATSQ